MAEFSQLDIFSSKPTIKSIVGVQWIEHRPIAAVDDGCCLEFQIPPVSQHYMDLDHSLLKLKVKVKKADGTPIAAGEKVGLTNNVLNSIFSQVDVTLNDLNISPSVGTNHPYRAFLEVLLDEGANPALIPQLMLGGYDNTELHKRR